MTNHPAAARLPNALFDLSPHIRYVAVRLDDSLSLHQRPDLADASSSESDRYEELLVNPTLLALTTARGRIDCGGLDLILIRYGNFFQLVHPLTAGHVSIAISPNTDPLTLIEPLRVLLRSERLILAN